jgi:3-dehydroquinate dehydratase
MEQDLAESMAQSARKKTGKIVTKRASRHSGSETASKGNAAAKLASLIELHMSDLGLSDEEKNLQVARFAKRADLAIESRAKS